MIYAPTIGGLPGYVLDGGVRDLSERFRKEVPNCESECFAWFAWKQPRDKAIRLFREGKLDYAAFGTHSFGGWKVLQAAADLAKHGIMVRYIANIDPTALPIGADPMVVPANVEFVDEFRAAWPSPPMFARLRDPSGGRGGMYVFKDGKPPHKIHNFMTGHIAIGSSKKVHDIAVARLREMTK
jgi:hypothetical protein